MRAGGHATATAVLDLEARRADTLSGGEQLGLTTRRALLHQPEIVLMDEPVAPLEPRSVCLLMDALLRLSKHLGLTVLCNLHTLELARTCCDPLVGMSAGQVLFDEVRNDRGRGQGHGRP